MNVESTISAENTNAPVVDTADSGTAHASVDLAPPFYSPWRWIRPYAPPGFWVHTRHHDSRGELVLQFGRRGGGGSATVASSYLRFEHDPSPKIYVVRFDPISLTRRPNHSGQVSLRAFLQVNSYKAPPRELYGGTQFMVIQASGRHVFRVGFEIELKAGATYGEVIGRIADVNQFHFYRSRSVADALEGEPGHEEIQHLLADHDDAKIEVVDLGSLQEVVTANGSQALEG